MSNDNFYADDDNFQPEEYSAPPRQGMSTGMKVLIAFLIFGGICLLLCCGGIFWAVRSTEFKVTENKEEIKEIQGDIATITLPEQFQPHAGMSMKIAGMNMRMAIYESESKKGAIILMSMGIPDDGMVDMEKEFQRNIKQNNQNQRDLNITKEEQREFTIKGQKVTFTFAEGKDKNDQDFHQITGVFSGNNGPAFLMVQVPSDEYNEDEMVKMIESIKE